MGTTTRTPLLFLIKPRTGITNKLRQVAQRQDTVRVLVEGPYGGTNLKLEKSYEQVVLVAGGSGISATLPMLSMLCKIVGREESILRSVKLIWVIKNRQAQGWVADEMDAVVATALPGSVKIDLYITGDRSRSQQLASSFEPEEIEMDVGFNTRQTSAGSRDDDTEEERLLSRAAEMSTEGRRSASVEDSDSEGDFAYLQHELGILGDFQEHRANFDEDQTLIPSPRHTMEHLSPSHLEGGKDYHIETNVHYGRPNFAEVLPRTLVQDKRICVIGECQITRIIPGRCC